MAAPTIRRFISVLTRILLGAILAFAPLIAFAAFDDVKFTSVTFRVTSGGTNQDVTVTATVEQLTMSDASFEVVMQATSSITVTSSDKRDISYSPSASQAYSKNTFTCGSDSSTLTLEASAAVTVTITPHVSGTCSAAAAAATVATGGSGGGGGGGGNPQFVPQTTTAAPPPAPAPTPAPTPAPAPAIAITSDLALGARSNEVAQLQAFLVTDKSIYPEGLVTGYFGPATQRAVKRFQAKYGLPQVGQVGPLTRAKLAEVFGKVTPPAPPPAPAPTPAPPPPAAAAATITKPLSRGSRDAAVSALQSLLAQDKSVYPEGLVTGFFGPATERAVNRFQEKHGIAKAGESGYGFVGPKTRAKLNELLGAPPAPAPTPAPTPAPAPSADEAAKIKALQDQLRQLEEQLKVLQGR